MRIKGCLLGLSIVFNFLSPLAIALDSSSQEAIQKHLNDNKIDEALSQLRLLIKANPKDKAVRFLLAQSYLLKADYSSAKKELLFAKQIGLEKSLWMPLLGKIYLLEGEYSKIFNELNMHKLVEKDPTIPWLQELRMIHGDAHLNLRQLKQAREYYQAALSLDPKYTLALLGLTQSYLLENNTAEAQRSWKQAHEHGVKEHNLKIDSKLQLLQAEIYKQKKDFDSARIAYLHAIDLDSHSIPAHLGLTQIYLLQRNVADFIKQATLLYQLAPKYSGSLYWYSIALYQQKKMDKAREILEQLVRGKPQHAPALLLLAKIYYNEERYEIAQDTLQKFLTLNPDHKVGQALKAAVLLKLRNPQKSIALLEPLVQENPHFQWQALLGHAYMLTGNLDKAIATLEKAASSMPEDPTIQMELVGSLLAKQEDRQAEAILEEVVAQHEHYEEADVLRIFVALKNNNPQKAESIAKNLLKNNPHNPISHNLLGLSLMQQKRFSQAEEQYKIAIQKAPNFIAAQNNLSELYFRQGNYMDAEKNLQTTLSQDNNNVRALLLHSLLSESKQDFEGALKWLRLAQERNPRDYTLTSQIVSLYLRHKKSDRAYEEALAGLAKFPNLPQAQHLVGQLAFNQNQHHKALEIYKKLAQKLPNNPQVLQGLARAYVALGDMHEASEVIEQVLAHESSNLTALLIKADIALKSKAYDSVEKIAQQIIGNNPKHPLGHRLYGDALFGKGLAKDSIKHYENAYHLGKNSDYAKAYYYALKNTNENAKSLAVLEQYVQEYPEDKEMHQFLATTYLTNNQLDQAKHHYEIVLQTKKNDYISLNNLAHVYLKKNDPFNAYEYAKKAYDLDPGNPQIADTFAWTLILRKEPNKAVPILTKALSSNPQLYDLRYHRAVGIYETGNKQLAISELENLLHNTDQFADKEQAQKFLHKIKSQQG